ncbi:MFS transporter (plasmid) [Paraburkholderia sp. PREW-6R]|uniref:MFS transporter n=1 Tax=Paraburkholderia sp. PREW-6R TaxID=3141544 RepID=UPI0031F4863D
METSSFGTSEGMPSSPWLGIWAIALGAFALVVTEFLPVGLLPGIMAGFGVSEGAAGLTVTATAAVGFIAAPITALTVGRLDRRAVLLALTFLVIVSGVASTVATSFAVLLVARMILGIGVGGFWTVSITAATKLAGREKAHKASSLVFSGISVASVVSVPLGSYISYHYDWRIAFAIASALSVAVLFLQIYALPRISMASGTSVQDYLRLLKSPKIALIYLAITLMVSGHFSGYTFVAPYLQQLAKFEPNAISGSLFMFGLVAVLGNFLGGALAGRDLHKTVYGNALLFFAALVMISALPQYPIVTAGSLLIWALSWGIAPVGTQLWLSSETQNAPEAAQSLNTSVFQFSISAGSMVGGIVTDDINLHAAMWAGAAIFALAVLMVVAVGRMTAAHGPDSSNL